MDLKIENEKKTIIDRFNNTFVMNQSNELVSVEINSADIELPECLEVVGKRVFNNRGFKNFYLNKNIKTFNNGAFIPSYVIENLYYLGSYEEFNKIYFEPGCGRKLLLDNVKSYLR